LRNTANEAIMAPAARSAPWATFDRLVVLPYLLLHIPITLFIDSQGLFLSASAIAAGQSLFPFLPPREAVLPGWAIDTLQWYLGWTNDPIMRHPPHWFQAIIAAEVVFQLPFFFVAVYAFLTRANWIKTPVLLYGAHVPTTVFPLLGTFLAPDAPLTPEQLRYLLALYVPFILMPLLLVWRVTATPAVFPAASAAAAAPTKHGKAH